MKPNRIVVGLVLVGLAARALAEGPIMRYHLTDAWPTKEASTTQAIRLTPLDRGAPAPGDVPLRGHVSPPMLDLGSRPAPVVTFAAKPARLPTYVPPLNYGKMAMPAAVKKDAPNTPAAMGTRR